MPDTQISDEMVRIARDAFNKCRPVERVACQDFGMQQNDILEQQLRAALEAALSGHVVVPREPTQAMIEAGWDAANRDIGGDVIGTIVIQSVIGRSVYRAMIQAAPPVQVERG